MIVLVIDTLRSDHLPSYGYGRETAPFLSRLATEGIQLQGYSASSWTRPSMATLLTGLTPQRHQTISRSDRLPADIPYLPELLAARGFETAAYMGNLNAGRKWGFARGVSRYRETRGVRAADADAAAVTDAVLRLELAPPFYLQVLYVDPHDPYRPPESWWEIDGGAPGAKPETLLQPPDVLAKGRPVAADDLERLRDQYDGEIRDVDGQIERLLGELEARGLLDETLVVVTADHGEEFGEHGGLTHGRTLHEEMLRVPFLLWGRDLLPGNAPAAGSLGAFHHIDFVPTMLGALGVEAPEGLDGTDRWAELTAPPRRASTAPPLYFHLDLDRHAALAVLEGGRKLIHRPRRPRSRVYDLADDPGEHAPSPLGRADEELLRRLVEHHNAASAGGVERMAQSTDAAMRRELAALGYLDLDTPEDELRARRIPPRLDPEFGFGR